MATLTTVPQVTILSTQGPNAAVLVAQAMEDLVNSFVDNGDKAADMNGGVNDALLQTVVWIFDVAGTLANDALAATQAAQTAKAQEAAECARGWSIVAMLVAVIVAIVVAVIAVLAAIWSGGAALSLIAAVAAIISSATAAIQGIPAALTIQGLVIESLNAIVTVNNPATPSSERERVRQDTVNKLRNAMTMIQTEASRKLPATSFDLNRAIGVSDQTSRALIKLLAFLRKRQANGKLALVVTELGQLVQTHSTLVAQLRLAKPAKG